MGLSISHLLVVLGIVVVIFGTKRLKNIGTDLGGAIKSFRAAVTEGEQTEVTAKNDIIDGKSVKESEI